MKSFFSSSPPPTQEELKKYLEGQMSVEERQAFEKRMESAELYSEGMEGIEMLPDGGALSKIMGELNARIDQKIAQKERFNYVPYWSAAAVLVLVCGLVFTFLRYQSHQAEIAVRDETAIMVHREELLPAPSYDKEPEPSAQVLKNSEPLSAPDLATAKPITKSDEAVPAEELNEMLPSRAYADSIIVEEKQSAPVAAQRRASSYDHPAIYNDMLVFAEHQIAVGRPSENVEEVVAIGYGSKTRSPEANKRDDQSENLKAA
ncbi:MAG TPA: hypothetical protein VF691_09945, partial [Cytophagaceae bacterium]